MNIVFDKLSVGQNIWFDEVQYKIMGLQKGWKENSEEIRLNDYPNPWYTFNKIRHRLSLTAPEPKFKYQRDTYIRFKHLPKIGVSTNHLTGEKEIGISVYHYTCINGEIRLIMPSHKASVCMDLSAVFRAGMPVLLVTGRKVGTGSNGEPLIRDVEIVKRITDWDSFPENKPDNDHYKNWEENE